MIKLRIGSKPGVRVIAELTPEEARRLRDHLTSRLSETRIQTSDTHAEGAAKAALAVEAARKEGKQ